MFDRFSPSSQQVMKSAHLAAAQAGHDQVGTLHLLWGLMAQEEGGAVRLLDQAGYSCSAIQERLRLALGMDPTLESDGRMSVSEGAKHVFHYVSRSVAPDPRSRIDTLHLLIGMLSSPTCKAHSLLVSEGVDPAKVTEMARTPPK